ncbi:hypothetical protein [Nocardia terpenica]|uniref:Uncharacterized protein n=1 Tax=Nocardia terpenica TaxID=455432 RepID=A0A164NSA3_9NOCA|nr:hypothetical protein [Nocardia terpenica]KZM74666.1 hypothetical protein AWN90_21625 [Nocardia terpenica]NQE93728.1 hypothetical protein [Nocardia terpenica]
MVLGATIASAAPSDEDGHQPLTNDHAYVFNQQLRDNIGWWNDSWMPQTVPDGAHIQIQLPSDPVQWTPDTGDTCQPSPTLVHLDQLTRSRVDLLGSDRLPDDGRITGSSAISVFDYRVTGTGVAALCLRPRPADADPDVLGFPPGTPPLYVLTVLVGVPQAQP